MARKVSIVIDVPFWRLNRGSLQRIHGQIVILKAHYDADVLFVGGLSWIDYCAARDLGIEVKSIEDFNTPSATLPQLRYSNFYAGKLNSDYRLKFLDYLSKAKPEVIIIHNLYLNYLVESLDLRICKIIDMHDLLSQRTMSFEKYGLLSERPIDQKSEFEMFSSYDYVIAIQEDDKRAIVENSDIPESKLLVCGHFCDIKQNIIADKVKAISYFGSKNLSNIEAVNWFLKKVWIGFKDEGIDFNIYGAVGEAVVIPRAVRSSVNVMGVVDDLGNAYSCSDIVVNPVQFGSGLKIKNIEALCYGKPLVTTQEGARGIEFARNFAFLQSDSADEFINALCMLIISKELRAGLSRNAIDLSKRYFSREVAYSPLVGTLAELSIAAGLDGDWNE